jgi:hypothetical protein
MASSLALSEALNAARVMQSEFDSILGPPHEGGNARSDAVLLRSVTRNTRDYIERLVEQINGCYEHGWYDASAVMIRRLLETLIIEAFEAYGDAQLIKNKNGDFVYLKELIDQALSYSGWNLGRNTKAALKDLKDIGDKSAHSRRFTAHRGDIDAIRAALRTAVQEFVTLANLKRSSKSV